MIIDNNIGIYIVAKYLNKELFRSMGNLFKNKEIRVVTTPEVIQLIDLKEWPNFLFINENNILDKGKIHEKLKLVGRVGWYYQQFLKYQTVLTAQEENIHIIDGDSIINPLLSESMILPTTGKRSFKKYSNFSHLAIGDSCAKYSFVTNQMVFNKNILREMLNLIENKGSWNWIDILIDIMKNNKDAIFSEYQIYGNYLFLMKKIKPKYIRVFRRMDCVKKSINSALEKYDVVAFEPQHDTGKLRIIRANFLYTLGLNLG